MVNQIKDGLDLKKEKKESFNSRANEDLGIVVRTYGGIKHLASGLTSNRGTAIDDYDAETGKQRIEAIRLMFRTGAAVCWPVTEREYHF
jgi:hypothetical protein